MERLTEHIGGMANHYVSRNGSDKGYWECIQKLGEYEDLEEQGLLLKLPCKVGDTIYLLDYEERKMDEATVEEIMIDSDGLFINTDYANYLHTKLEYVFLTKAESEKALAEMEKGVNE